MARRGTTKQLSIEQEDYVARQYGGKRSPSSGAASHDYGDVRTPHGKNTRGQLIECKGAGSPAHPLKVKPALLSVFEKIAQEAFAEGREPMLAFRYHCPDSFLADREGWIDLSVRLMCDDVERGNHEED